MSDIKQEILNRLEAMLAGKSVKRDTQLEAILKTRYDIDIPLVHSVRCTLMVLKVVIEKEMK